MERRLSAEVNFRICHYRRSPHTLWVKCVEGGKNADHKGTEERKQEIFDAALKLFGEKGYEKTTITDIAKEIGVAQGLCYRYFPSKEVLFDSAIDQYADLLAAQYKDLAEKQTFL